MVDEEMNEPEVGEVEKDGLNDPSMLTGSSSPKKIRLLKALMGHMVVILVDTRSTHNYLHHRIAQRI
ncbi:hypothetical protein Pint_24910 [Pistacia integerrima]|uniref:Uncharacterized protein n=1 Tax=Pistacia integerrima TaxID=434235 RepID=A0ACC0YEC7_9ROSI|nr:hypothetical protein Pint_24910 [Pistacia integerrima]